MSSFKNLTVRGQLNRICPGKAATEKMNVQTAVLTVPGEYPDNLTLTFVNDNIALLRDAMIGEEYEATFGIRGGKMPDDVNLGPIVNLNCWKFTKV